MTVEITENDILGDPPVSWEKPKSSTRKCIRCGQELPTSEFYPKASRVCRSCKEIYHYPTVHAEQCKQYRAIKRKNPAYVESEKKRAKEYYHKTAQKRRDDWLAEYRTACLKCGETRSWVLVWHHIDPCTKKYNIGNGCTRKDRQQEIIEETKKCVNLCENCHRDFHHIYGNKMTHPKADLEEYLGIKLKEETK